MCMRFKSQGVFLSIKNFEFKTDFSILLKSFTMFLAGAAATKPSLVVVVAV